MPTFSKSKGEIKITKGDLAKYYVVIEGNKVSSLSSLVHHLTPGELKGGIVLDSIYKKVGRISAVNFGDGDDITIIVKKEPNDQTFSQ